MSERYQNADSTMENSMNKAELAAQLGANGIQFPKEATVADLKALYSKTVGCKKTTNGEDAKQPNEGDGTANSDSDGRKKNSDPDGTKIDSDSDAKGLFSENSKEKKTIESADEEQKELNRMLFNVPKTKAAIELHNIQIEEELLEAKLR